MRHTAKDSMPIDGETKLMGLLGEGIAYTLSPRLHNRAAALLHVNAAYLPLSMPEADIEPFLKVAWHLGAVGFNVTTPHKEFVARLLNAKGCRSANTIYRGRDGWLAASTDGPGFVSGLSRADLSLSALKKLVVLGNGGSVVAILEHLATLAEGPKEIVLLRRDGSRDAGLKALMPDASMRFAELVPQALTQELDEQGDGALLLQATSAPRGGDDLSSLVPALARYRGALVDIIYGKPSALYFAAIAKDLVAQDGEAMLIEQARLSQKLWWGKSASYDVLARALQGR